MKNFISKILFLFLLLSTSQINSQTNTIFYKTSVQTSNSTSTIGNDFLNRTATTSDSNNDKFIAGSRLNSTTGVHDFFIEKYKSSGVFLWTQVFNVPNGGDFIVGNITVDDNDNVIITGSVSLSNNYDVVTLKYNPLGVLQWSETWNNTNVSGQDGGSAITTDNNGNIFITGFTESSTNFQDCLTLKYNSSGTLLWDELLDNNGLMDSGIKVIFNTNYLSVLKLAQQSLTNWSVKSLRYNLQTGQLLSNNTVMQNIVFNEVNTFASDDLGNLYIAGAKDNGASGYDYLVMKLNSSLNVQWQQTLDEGGNRDIPKSINFDLSGNVYVTGETETANSKDFLTAKYDVNGVFQWKKTLDYSGDDIPSSLVVDNSGDLFIAGSTQVNGNKDYLTAWYDTNGVLKWTEAYNSIYNDNDDALDIQLIDQKELLVTGKITDANNNQKTTIVRYKKSKEYVIPPNTDDVSTSTSFVENKGQLLQSDGNPASGVKFYSDAASIWANFQEDKISLVQTQLNGGNTDEMYRIDIEFPGSYRDRGLFALEKRSDYFHQYSAHAPEGREFIPLHNRLVYNEVFKNIDIQVATTPAGIKYYFIIKPGGDPAELKLALNGQSSLSVTSGELVMGTSLGDIVLPEGFAYELDDAGNTNSLGWTPTYNIGGSVFKFNTGTYDNTKHLVIEVGTPLACNDFNNENDNLRWATFYENTGHSPDEFFNEMVNDGNNIYVSGITANTSFPTIVASNVGELGNKDAFLIKFNGNGVRQWALKIGGSASDEGVSCFADNQGEIILGGLATSSNFPTQDAGLDWFDNTREGARDAFLARFSTMGVREFSSFFGTDDDFESVQCITQSKDSGGEFYIGGIGVAPLKNIDNSPMNTAGVFYMARFSSDFTNHEFTSQYGLFGGFGKINDIDTDFNGNIFITGEKEGAGVQVIGANAEAYHNGVSDAFIAKISFPPHNLLFSTNIGGNARDSGEALELNVNGTGLYYAGFTNSPSILGITGSNAGGFDGFIAARNSVSMNPIFSSFLGGSANEKIFDISMRSNNEVFIVGESSTETIFVTATPDNFFSQTQSGSTGSINTDILIAAFPANLSSPLWATFMGDTPTESGTAGTIIQSKDEFFFTGITGFSAPEDVSFPLRPNNVGQSYFECIATDASGQQNGIIGKFELNYFYSNLHEDNEAAESFTVYPNPSSGYVRLVSSNNQNYSINIFSATGKKIKSIEALRGETELTDFLNLAKGIYFLNIIQGPNIENKKIIVQ